MFLLWGQYVRKYYLRYLIFVLIGFASLVLVDIYQLKIPEIIGGVVDELKTNGTIDINSAFFINSMIDVVVIAIVMFVGRILWRLTLFYASKKIDEKIRNEMFIKAEKLDISYFHTTKVGNILSWCTNDLETLQDFLGWGTLQMIDGVFLTIFALSKMFILDYALALIALVPISLIAVWGAICEKQMSKIWDLRQESNDNLYDYSQESFTGIRVIKAFVKERQQIRRFAKLARENQEANIKFTFISVLFDVVIEIIIALVAAIILGFGGWFVYATITGSPVELFGHQIIIQPGRLVTFFGYFFSLIWPMIALGQVVTNLSKARTSYKRIARFLDAEESIRDNDDAIELNDVQGKIVFNDFSFSYPDGDFDSLKNISLEIKPGETIGVIGKVGSGKTTLVNVLLRLYNVEKDSIYIDDIDLMNIKLKSLRDAISIAPQDNFLFSDSIANNISFADDEEDRDKVIASANFADVGGDIEGFPEQYDEYLGEDGHTVSGGQKQRISLARAYYKNAPILILDDSLSAVDLKTENNILDNIEKERKGKTTIIIASRVSSVMNLDKIIVLNKGRLEAFDTPKNLLTKSETFKRMVALQKLEREAM